MTIRRNTSGGTIKCGDVLRDGQGDIGVLTKVSSDYVTILWYDGCASEQRFKFVDDLLQKRQWQKVGHTNTVKRLLEDMGWWEDDD